MKRIYFFLSILFVAQMHAQQSTFLHFEDKNGLKDSLEIAIGLTEDQIAALPYYTVDEAEHAFKDSTLWVLLEEGMWYELKYSQTYPYKQYSGMIVSNRREIMIPADRLPVKISWDKQFFIENDLTHSIMSDMGSWFDCGCRDGEIYILLLTDADSCVVHDTFNGSWCSYEYVGDVIVKHIGIALGAANNPIESIETIPADTPSASKQLRDGHIFILRGDKTYTLTGQPYGDK